MDVATALQSLVPYPLTENQIKVTAARRGLVLNQDFDNVVGTKAFDLADADLIKLVVMHPNISEGGVSISLSDRKALIAEANRIYRQYDEPLIEDEHPAVYPIDD